MPEPSTFDRILSRLDESDGVIEKVASEETATPSTEAVMLDTVRRVSEAHVKTASAPEVSSPAASLEAMAKQAADLEEDNLIKQAQTMGAHVCDGFFERYAAYDTALQGQEIKTAAPANLEAAREEGRQEATAHLEKQSQESFNAGYENTMQSVYKTAAEIHYQGQTVARQLLNESKQS